MKYDKLEAINSELRKAIAAAKEVDTAENGFFFKGEVERLRLEKEQEIAAIEAREKVTTLSTIEHATRKLQAFYIDLNEDYQWRMPADLEEVVTIRELLKNIASALEDLGVDLED